MARLIALALIAGLVTGVSGVMTFINPPPFGRRGDFSDSDTYRQGSLVNVAWTPGEEGGGASLVLYQLNDTDGQWFGDMEYLTSMRVSIPTILMSYETD